MLDTARPLHSCHMLTSVTCCACTHCLCRKPRCPRCSPWAPSASQQARLQWWGTRSSRVHLRSSRRACCGTLTGPMCLQRVGGRGEGLVGDAAAKPVACIWAAHTHKKNNYAGDGGGSSCWWVLHFGLEIMIFRRQLAGEPHNQRHKLSPWCVSTWQHPTCSIRMVPCYRHVSPCKHMP